MMNNINDEYNSFRDNYADADQNVVNQIKHPETNYNDEYYRTKNIIDENSFSKDNLIDGVGGFNSEEPAETFEQITEEFKKFEGDYETHVQNFPNMSERDQKLFILYSVFHLGLKFNREHFEGVVSSEVLEKTEQLSAEFVNYGSYTGCAISCSLVYDVPSFHGFGYNIIYPMECLTCFRSLDSLSVKELAVFANSGYSAADEEEMTFQALDETRNRELASFNQLLSTLVNNNRK